MIDLPLPPSTHSKDKQAAKDWAEQVKQRLEGLQRPPGSSYEVIIDLWGPWRDENGKRDPKMPDIDRMIYKLLDLIAQAAGYNDRCHDRLVVNRHQSTFPRCTVTLGACPLLYPGR